MNTVLLAFVLATFTGLMILFASLSMGGLYTPIIFAFVTGLIVGDVSLGLQVGAACALMALGFYTYGGATTPDYNVGAMFGVVVASQSGDVTQGIVIGSVIALLMSWFDILGRAATTVFQHGGDRALARKDVKAFEKWHLLGTMGWFWSRFIPVFIGMLFIDKYTYIADFVAKYAWIKNGLSVIGKCLPAVGFALLLSYMDIKHYWPFMLLGYALFAFMGVPTLGLAIVGIVAGALFAKKSKGEAE
ncbi:MAG: PTS sugar transporter subunit IIC [Oscillospiraceae bacterium]|nr:PTS sugar transporter subunit IIC [Oscillospiraceae bacterium]